MFNIFGAVLPVIYGFATVLSQSEQELLHQVIEVTNRTYSKVDILWKFQNEVDKLQEMISNITLHVDTRKFKLSKEQNRILRKMFKLNVTLMTLDDRIRTEKTHLDSNTQFLKTLEFNVNLLEEEVKFYQNRRETGIEKACFDISSIDIETQGDTTLTKLDKDSSSELGQTNDNSKDSEIKTSNSTISELENNNSTTFELKNNNSTASELEKSNSTLPELQQITTTITNLETTTDSTYTTVKMEKPNVVESIDENDQISARSGLDSIAGRYALLVELDKAKLQEMEVERDLYLAKQDLWSKIHFYKKLISSSHTILKNSAKMVFKAKTALKTLKIAVEVKKLQVAKVHNKNIKIKKEVEKNIGMIIMLKKELEGFKDAIQCYNGLHSAF